MSFGSLSESSLDRLHETQETHYSRRGVDLSVSGELVEAFRTILAKSGNERGEYLFELGASIQNFTVLSHDHP